MPYGEPQLSTWDLRYAAELQHPTNGAYLVLTATASHPETDGPIDTAVQDALDLLVANGWTPNGAYKQCLAQQVITPTPTEPPE